MKNLICLTVLTVALLGASGCSNSGSANPSTAAASSTPTVEVAYALGSIKKGDKAHCVVCATREGSSETETVSETLDYKGKTYAFCNEKEKAEFISEPAKYAAASK